MSKPTITEILSALKPQVTKLEGFLGAVVLGSVSAGMQDETSDCDVRIIVSDEAFKKHPEYEDTQITVNARHVDGWITSLSDLRGMDRFSWEAREYVHAKVLFDENGDVKSAIRDMITIPESDVHSYAFNKLDGYYNGVFRSLKCQRHGFDLGFHYMASESVQYLIDAVYGVNGTIAPFVNRAPYVMKDLSKLPMPHAIFSKVLLTVASTAEVATQIALYDAISLWMESQGYKDVLDGWEGVLEAEVDLARERITGCHS